MPAGTYFLRRKKGISETLSAVLLIALTLGGLSVVMAYYISSQDKGGAGLIDQAELQGINAGQILRVIYYTSQNGSVDFYLEDIGNMPITIQQCYSLNAATQTIPCHLFTSPPNPRKLSHPTIEPGKIYLLEAFTNDTDGITVESTTYNVIALYA